MVSKNRKYKIVFTFVLITCLVNLLLSSLRQQNEQPPDTDTSQAEYEFILNNSYRAFSIGDECECRRKEPIKFFRSNSSEDLFTVSLGAHYYHDVNLTELNRTTCDLANTLRRPRGQKVYSVSLYGKNKRYYRLLKYLVARIREVYPGWILRVYHDKSILLENKCEIECLKEPDGDYYDNVDFCDIENIPRIPYNAPDLSQAQPSDVVDVNKLFVSWNASYVHSSMWRYMAIGDLFIAAFMSRDLDMEIYQREVAAVKEWLDSDFAGHIMRDHPYHQTEILAGMWGFYNQRNHRVARRIYESLIDVRISQAYKKKNEFGQDQKFPIKFIHPLIVNMTLQHDSYFCKMFPINTRPFGVRRDGACWIGIWYDPGMDCQNGNTTIFKCPLECRPKKHQDWINC